MVLFLLYQNKAYSLPDTDTTCAAEKKCVQLAKPVGTRQPLMPISSIHAFGNNSSSFHQAAPLSSSLRGSPFLKTRNRPSMGRRILALQHSERLQTILAMQQAAKKFGATWQTIKIWQESAVDFADFDALIILAAPCNLTQDDRYPFLHEEKRLLRAWMHLNRPYLGFNLGLHLIAEAAGASIGPTHSTGKRITEGHLTHEGKKHPLFRGVISPFRLFKQNDLEILPPLPRNMVLLATSKECMVEACCLEGQPHIVGLQCEHDLNTSKDLATQVNTQRIQTGTGRRNLSAAPKLLAPGNGLASEITANTELLLRNFISLLK